MAWVEIRKKGLKQIHVVTEEAYKSVFIEQGFELVNKVENESSTNKKEVVQETAQPKPETTPKRQYTKRNSK